MLPGWGEWTAMEWFPGGRGGELGCPRSASQLCFVFESWSDDGQFPHLERGMGPCMVMGQKLGEG